MFQSVKYIYFLLFIFYSTTYCQSTIFDPETGKHYPISDASRIEDIPFILPDPDPKLYPPEFLNSLLKHCDDPMPGYIEMFSKAWIAFKEMGFNWSNYPSSLFFFLRIISAIRPIQVFHAILTGSALTTLRIYITRRFFVKLISDVGVTPETANKLVESCWKGFWFLIMWLFSLKVVILSGRTDFQYPLRAFRDIKFEVGFFDIPTPPDYYWLYTLQLGFYLHSLWSVFFMDAWRKDSSVLVLHHCLSLILLESSLLLRLHRMGVLVLFLHDICDVFLEVGKVNVYLRIRHGKTYPIHMTIANMFFCTVHYIMGFLATLFVSTESFTRHILGSLYFSSRS
uniref:Putative LAG1 longevity assurance homolog 1 n=1 Tax=Schistosoma japonicum TaxID=6182 RepID=C1L3Q3_SCHJA|nr:putative LAG1 longevity assurance homolog 1 [Schistosoma japonicum]